METALRSLLETRYGQIGGFLPSLRKGAFAMDSKQEKELVSLQVRLPVAEWMAFKMECLKQRVSASAMIQRVLVAQLPSVAAAARNQAA